MPTVPPTYIINLISILPGKWAKNFAKAFKGYIHHGDMRYLTKCDNAIDVELISNYNEVLRMLLQFRNKKQCKKDHSIELYSEKLGCWALKRNMQD